MNPSPSGGSGTEDKEGPKDTSGESPIRAGIETVLSKPIGNLFLGENALVVDEGIRLRRSGTMPSPLTPKAKQIQP